MREVIVDIWAGLNERNFSGLNPSSEGKKKSPEDGSLNSPGSCSTEGELELLSMIVMDLGSLNHKVH